MDEDAASGWPMVPGDTSLIIKVPEADHLVPDGFVAHVTVLVPFLPVRRIDDAVELRLVELFGSHDGFDLTFSTVCRYPGLLYLDPQPHEPVEALGEALTRCWPDAVPYWGIFGAGLAPHLTIARWDRSPAAEAEHDALESRLASALPIHTHVHRIDLTVWDGTRWSDHRAYTLR